MELIIILGVITAVSIGLLVVQTMRINKIKIAGIKSETIIKQANRQADKAIRDAKYQAEKETKAMVRRAEDDIAFKKRQVKEMEKDVEKAKTKLKMQNVMPNNCRIVLNRNWMVLKIYVKSKKMY